MRYIQVHSAVEKGHNSSPSVPALVGIVIGAVKFIYQLWFGMVGSSAVGGSPVVTWDHSQLIRNES
jgi:hypothetical protein